MMEIIEALRLFREKEPEELSAEEFAALSQRLESNESLVGMLGGPEVVQEYLACAEAALQHPAANPQKDTADDGQPALDGPRPPNPLRDLALLLLLLGIGLAGLWLYFYGLPWRTPVAESVATNDDQTAESEAADPDGQPGEERSASAKHTDVRTKKKDHPGKPHRAASATEARKADANKPHKWQGWTILVSPRGRMTHHVEWDISNPDQPVSYRLPVTRRGEVTFRATHQIREENAWLQLVVRELEGATVERDGTPGVIEVRAEGRVLGRGEVPPAGSDYPLVVSLEPLIGRNVELQVVHLAKGDVDAAVWYKLELVKPQKQVSWTPLDPLAADCDQGCDLQILPDHSVLAGGAKPPHAIYVVTAKIDQPRVTALRLETLCHPSLPGGGPGRGPGGRYAMHWFSAAETDQKQNGQPLQQLTGRFVRVELPGQDRFMMLAEVEVFSGGKNVAKGKPASQSSTVYQAPASRAVDGNNHGGLKGRSLTYTDTEDSPWWEVDLEGEVPLDRIVVWNRTSRQELLANHRVVVLDSKRAPIWTYDNKAIPERKYTYGPFVKSHQPLSFSAASKSDAGAEIAQVKPSGLGWSAEGFGGRPRSFVFTLDKSHDLGGKTIEFRLGHLAGSEPLNLGRFRLSVTDHPPPVPAEPPFVVLPPPGKQSTR